MSAVCKVSVNSDDEMVGLIEKVVNVSR